MQVVAPWSRRPGSPKLRPKNDRARTKPTGSQTTGSRKVEKWRWARCGQTKWTQPYSTYFFIILAQGCGYNFLSGSIKLRRFYCCFMNKRTKKIYPVSLVCALIPIIVHSFVHDCPCREFQSLNLNFSAVRSYLKHPYILKQQRTIRAVFKLSQQFKSPLLKGLHILWVDDNFVLVFSRVNDPFIIDWWEYFKLM